MFVGVGTMYDVREELVSSVNIQESTCLHEKISENLSFTPFRLSGTSKAIRVSVRS